MQKTLGTIVLLAVVVCAAAQCDFRQRRLRPGLGVGAVTQLLFARVIASKYCFPIA
jgi:hypothetical protein